MKYLGEANFLGKPRTFWLGNDAAVYTAPWAQGWSARSWPTVETFRQWATATQNMALVVALDQARGGA